MNGRKRIAMISSPWYSVPPIGYGGSELIVYNLCKGLIQRGWEVTLFAPPESQVEGVELISVFDKEMREFIGDNSIALYYGKEVFLHHILPRRKEFDIIHNNFHNLVLVLAETIDQLIVDLPPVVNTLHGKVTKQNWDLFNSIERVYNIPISNHQSQKYPPRLKRTKVVYNSIDPSEYYYKKEGNFWLYFSRCCPDKGSHLIPEIVKKTGARILMCCKVDPGEPTDYYKEKVKPYIDKNWDEIKVSPPEKIKMIIESNAQSGVEWLGEVNVEGKRLLFAYCKGHIFTLQWSEPFGITPLEAAASGKITVAFPFGALPETIIDGKTGFLCGPVEEMNNPKISTNEAWERYENQAMAEMVDVVKMIDKGELTFNPLDCMAQANNFSIDRMVEGYEKVYKEVYERNHKKSHIQIAH